MMNGSLIEQMEKDLGVSKGPSDDKLDRIVRLAGQMRDMETLLSDMVTEMDKLTNRLKEVQERELPDAMAEVGLSEFRLTDGSKIRIEKRYYGSIKDMPTAKAWLDKNDMLDIMKSEIKVDFQKGEMEKKSELAETISKLGYKYSDKEYIHPQTLSAFIREQIEAGSDLPMDAFGVSIINKAKIK
jgi:hypothetical protein